MYNFRGENYNYNRNRIYNNPYISNMNNFQLSPERYQPYRFTPMTPPSHNLPYLYTNSGSNIYNPYINPYQIRYPNPYYINNFSEEYNPRFNIRKENLNFGLPLIIHRAEKLKDAIAIPPKIENKNNNHNHKYTLKKGVKKSNSNFFYNSNIKDLPDIHSLEIDKKEMPMQEREVFFEKILKRNKTEDQLLNNKIIDKINKKNWWKLLKYFVEVYSFFSILKKYTFKIKKIRNEEIFKTKENIVDEVFFVRNWILDLQGDFWNNLLKFKDINISFNEFDKYEKISLNSKTIIQFIEEFFYNLKIKTNDIEIIPKNIQNIIYKYIKKNAYYPIKYLNLFHLKKLNFDFYGSCLNSSIEESAMNLSYLLISNISVQQIFLNIKYVFKELKDYENILIAARYIGSIIYYLERNAFVKIKINNSYIDLFNYYRCYRIKNDILEKEYNIKVLLGISKMTKILKYKDYLNDDIYYNLLIDDKSIDKFWQLNSSIMKKISNSFFIWSLNLAKLILSKFEKKNK